ncbi:MAG: aminotransferase [Pseudomonadota bacterium]
MQTNPAFLATFPPPVPEAQRWIRGISFPPDRPLINVSQAAPVDPPPEALRAAMAEAVLTDPHAHAYGPVLGNSDLREAVAAKWALHYGGDVRATKVAITQGCNQAFVAAMATLAGAGDEVILPTPWYFNHKMWLDMTGVGSVPLPTGGDLVPDAAAARALITDRTRAIALVSPNNPAGVEYPAATLRAFFDLARAHDIALIVDETYRDFHSQPGAPHDLFADPDWDDTLIQLYSFSKAYHLTGHRVGAILASEARLEEVEKFLDTVAICAPQVGQIGALWGLENLSQWLAEERDEVLARRAAIEARFPALAAKGWRLRACGAYFAYVSHPFADGAELLGPRLVQEAGVLALPATMFVPPSDPSGSRHFRIAFANLDRAGIAELFARLAPLDM